jgi:hypothetical protein
MPHNQMGLYIDGPPITRGGAVQSLGILVSTEVTDFGPFKSTDPMSGIIPTQDVLPFHINESFVPDDMEWESILVHTNRKCAHTWDTLLVDHRCNAVSVPNIVIF